jgi:hypothetical protein
MAVIAACGASWAAVKRIQCLTWTARPIKLRDRLSEFWKRAKETAIA